jgi:hypothetical protein
MVRLLGRVVAAMTLLGVLALSVVFVLNLRAERQAVSLLQAVRTLRIGHSTEADVQRLVRRYGGEAGGDYSGLCPSPERTHTILIGSDKLNSLGERAAWLRPFGNRVWWVAVGVVMSHGTVCWISWNVRADSSHNYTVLSLQTDSVQGYPADKPYDVSAGTVSYFRRIRVQLSTDAPPESFNHAFDYDLSCLARLGGCRTTCEVMPSAWVDYQKEAHERGWPLPPEELGDRHCEYPPLQ